MGLNSACGIGGPGATPSPNPSPPVVFGFAGVNSTQRVEEVRALRATINWTVEPVVVRGYPVSTWMAFAVATPGHGVSNQIAQIGWIELDPGDPHLFWEWGSSSSDTHRQIGKPVYRGGPLTVEVDMGAGGTVSFIADGAEVGTTTVPWVPNAIGAFVETHAASEYLPGTAANPETLTGFDEKVAGAWVPYSGRVFTTNSRFHVSTGPDDSISIWDERQPT